jgi:hypothetical protein
VTDKRRALLAVIRAVVATAAWLVGCTLVVTLTVSLEWFQQRVTFGQVFVLTMAFFAGIGGLWGFWNISWRYEFYRSGYRVRSVGGHDYAYEEFGSDGKTYAPPCRISVPTLDQWEGATPPWAHGRRDEILSRLTTWAQAGYGAAVTL